MARQLAPRIVIIGAGSGGLSCAIALKRQLGFEDFIIYEKGHGVGGTWRDNVYPGCSSDVPMAFYSLSTDLRNWKESHGSQEDIHNYWISLAVKYNIYSKIRFNEKVSSAEWDSVAQCYHIVTENVLSGKKETSTAKILVSAIGILETPRYADIPGLENFKGEMFHSARWDKAASLKGKRVGVVGNGASATQFVPCITVDPTTQVLHFCRTPNWFMPPIREPYSRLRQQIFHIFPFLMRIVRFGVFLRTEALYLSVFANSISRHLLTKLAKSYITRTAPKEYCDKLVPTFTLGCKRIIFDTNYLSSLHRQNLDLNWDGIESIVEDGLVSKTGEHIKLDVLILATGYSADFYPFPIRGQSKKTIQQYYNESQGAKAYLGTAVPGFPNFFMISGPNTITGHTSVIFTSEVQINYILQVIKPILNGMVSSLEVKVAPTDAYNDKIHQQLNKSVFTQCLSWYRVGGQGKITNAFPRSSTTFWMWLRKPNWNHYQGVKADTWLRKQRFLQRLRTILRYTLVASAILYGASRKLGYFKAE